MGGFGVSIEMAPSATTSSRLREPEEPRPRSRKTHKPVFIVRRPRRAKNRGPSSGEAGGTFQAIIPGSAGPGKEHVSAVLHLNSQPSWRRSSQTEHFQIETEIRTLGPALVHLHGQQIGAILKQSWADDRFHVVCLIR